MLSDIGGYVASELVALARNDSRLLAGIVHKPRFGLGLACLLGRKGHHLDLKREVRDFRVILLCDGGYCCQADLHSRYDAILIYGGYGPIA